MKFRISRVEVFVCRAPIDEPVMTSFGHMHDRPAVLVRVEDTQGSFGWGEVWCNYPTCGAEHRARLIETVFAPLLIGFEFEQPEEIFTHLTDRSHVLAIQTAEVGPIAQCIAGLDIAVWDLVARSERIPLYKRLGGEQQSQVPVYASGINPTGAVETVGRARESGYIAFKVKIGFGHDSDFEVLSSVFSELQEHECLMADANQSWSIDEAIDFLGMTSSLPIAWLEEPIRADRPEEEWAILAEAADFPLAAGENIRGADAFENKLTANNLGIVQPDICKWGGLSANLPIVRSILASGHRYCPHYLGGGIGLMASAHLLAAAGGDGLLEVDFNDNPLREGLADLYPAVSAGQMALNCEPGLGVIPHPSILSDFGVLQFECRN